MNADPDRTRSAPPADPTADFDPAWEAGLAAAFAPEPTPGGWSRPPLLRDDPSADSPIVHPASPEMPKGSPSRYQLLGEIARGGMGVVLKGRDPDLGRDVAVKVLKAELAGRAAAEQRFVEEAQVGGQLQHPGVVPVYELGRFADGRPFFTMKLVKGRTLAALLAERPDPGHERGRWLKVFESVCQAVAYAHSRGVIHRDLKPANVMVGSFGEVQVMDWGLAKVLQQGGLADEEKACDRVHPSRPGEEPTVIRTVRAGSTAGSYTEAGSVLGTPAFMPPEQAGGEIDKLDERADVFGLGAILCVILTGQPPYVAANAEAVRLLAVRGNLADAFARLDGCGADAELVGQCKRCLAPEPADRPRHAGKITSAVTKYLAGVEERAHRAEVERAAADARAAEQSKRRRVQAALGLTLMAVVGAVGLGLWWQDRQQQRAEADRAARRARTASGVSAALEDARTRLGEGWGQIAEPKRMTDTAAHAENAVRRAEGLVEAGDADDATRAEASAVRVEVDDLSRHARLLADADRIVWQHAHGSATASRAEHYRRSVGHLAAALRAFGVDPTGPPDVVGPAVAASRIRDRLLGCLHELELWYIDADPAERKRVQAVLRSAKRSAGGVLARWQAANDAQNLDGLVAISAGPDVLDLGPMLINALGRQLSGARRYQAWLDLLRRSADRYPEYPWVHYDLMVACTRVVPPLRQEALRHAAAAAALAPNSPTFQYNLSEAYSLAGAHDRAAECARKAIALAPGATEFRFRLMNALLAAGDPAAAGVVLVDALAIRPDDVVLNLWLRGLRSRTGDLVQSAALLRAAVARFDPSVHASAVCRRLVAVLVQDGLHADALALLTRVMDRRPEWSTDPTASLRFPAARCAVVLAAGSADRLRLLRQARDWLAADLAAWRKAAATGDQDQSRSLTHQAMADWLADPMLASVRDRAAVEQLPTDDRIGWVKLWAEVRELRDVTAPPELAPPPRPSR